MEAAYAPYNWQVSEASEFTIPIDNVQGAYADGYDVHCHIQEHGHDLLSLTISMPDIITAEKVKNSFVKNGSIIYSMFVEELTGKDE